MDIRYKRDYGWCTNRLKVLNEKRRNNMNMIPSVHDEITTSEFVGLTYKQGLLKSAINNPSNVWTIYDHLLYLYDHPELRDQEESFF